MSDLADTADAAARERVRDICAGFEQAAEGELQDRPLFHVRRRRFAIFNGESSPARKRWDGAGRSLHFLSDPDERDALRHDPRFSLSPHHGDRGWLAVRIADIDDDEMRELLESAYRQVAR